MQAEIELLCTSKPQLLECNTSMATPPSTCDPGRADRVNLPHVLSSHEEATVRCAKARPGSNSSSGSRAPVRSKTSGPHASAQHTADAFRFHQSLWRWAPCRTHPISKCPGQGGSECNGLISTLTRGIMLQLGRP